jgi:Zn-dependent M28 family amino/carboxypeptidase
MSEASLVADVEWLTDPVRAGRGSRSEEAKVTARWIADELRRAGYAPVMQPITLDAPGQSNVIAELGPKTGPAVMILAHYDHLGVVDGVVHPGADDNASGVAVALAVARELQRARSSGRVVFLFTGAEEIGLHGAKAYVAAPHIPLDQIRAVYNLDMVGRNFFASTANEAAKLAAVGLPDDAAVSEAAEAAATDAGLTLLAVRPGLLQIVGEANRSDDWVFRDHGVFAVHFSTGINDDYHRPSDTPDKISRPQLVRMAKFVRSLVTRTAR